VAVTTGLTPGRFEEAWPWWSQAREIARQLGERGLEARVVPHAKEKITENNSRFFSVRVSGQKIRVFYYEGTPRWSYKFLTRELKRDPQLALQALLRTNTDALYQTSSSSEASEARNHRMY
jgi:hypothetical protein